MVNLFGGWLGDTQLKSLCVISSISLVVTVGVTCAAVTERIQLTRFGEKKKGIWIQVLNVVFTLYKAVLTLPKRISLIFYVQICSWYGWFLFLFYSSTWVGEVYTKYSKVSDSSIIAEKDGSDTVGDIARIGSLSLTVFSTVSLFFSLVLPEILRRLDKRDDNSFRNDTSPKSSKFPRIAIFRRVRLGIKAIVRFLFNSFGLHPVIGSRIKPIDLSFFWLISQAIYAVASFSMIFVTSITQATVIVGIFGICWSITTWAPFSLLAEEVLLLGQRSTQKYKDQSTARFSHYKKDNDSDQDSIFTHGSRARDIEMMAMAVDNDESDQGSIITRPKRSSSVGTIEIHVAQPEFDEEDQISPKPKNNDESLMPEFRTHIRGEDNVGYGSRHKRNISLTEDDFFSDGSNTISTTGEHSGVYLGLHNVAITIPQLLSTFVSFLVFAAVEQNQNELEDGTIEGVVDRGNGDGGFAIAVTMQLGGVAALLSIYFIIKLRQEK